MPKLFAKDPKPLTSRPLDLVYVVFFLSHIPASFLLDLQSIYPSHFVPAILKKAPELYFQMSNDPLIGGIMGYLGNKDHLVWFKSFLLLELVFQVPVFFLGIRGLWKGSRSIYILLLIYAASTTTTTLPCLAVLLTTPITSPQTPPQGASITPDQRLLLLSSYIPFFVIPLVMTLDMASRVWNLVEIGIKAEKAEKSK
jgi:hypothetical protein